jgi:hypothetical protein
MIKSTVMMGGGTFQPVDESRCRSTFYGLPPILLSKFSNHVNISQKREWIKPSCHFLPFTHGVIMNICWHSRTLSTLQRETNGTWFPDPAGNRTLSGVSIPGLGPTRPPAPDIHWVEGWVVPSPAGNPRRLVSPRASRFPAGVGKPSYLHSPIFQPVAQLEHRSSSP